MRIANMFQHFIESFLRMSRSSYKTALWEDKQGRMWFVDPNTKTKRLIKEVK